jgi:hypothetical protein
LTGKAITLNSQSIQNCISLPITVSSGKKAEAVIGYHLPANDTVEQMQHCCGKRTDSTLTLREVLMISQDIPGRGWGRDAADKCMAWIEQHEESN